MFRANALISCSRKSANTTLRCISQLYVWFTFSRDLQASMSLGGEPLSFRESIARTSATPQTIIVSVSRLSVHRRLRPVLICFSYSKDGFYHSSTDPGSRLTRFGVKWERWTLPCTPMVNHSRTRGNNWERLLSCSFLKAKIIWNYSRGGHGMKE